MPAPWGTRLTELLGRDDDDGTPTAQTDWRFCGKCNGLFYSGADGNYLRQNQRCPAGDLHLPLGYNFVLTAYVGHL